MPIADRSAFCLAGIKMKRSRNYFSVGLAGVALAAAGISSDHRQMSANKTGWTGGTRLAGAPRPPELAQQQRAPSAIRGIRTRNHFPRSQGRPTSPSAGIALTRS